MKWLLSFVSAVLFSLMLTGGVRAREEIRNYQVDIEVRTDASIEVTETITVNAEGNDIRRGIYRDIPLRALDDWGLWSSNGFDLVEVLHNGQPSPYHTEWQGRFFRILIGDADVFIPRGEHTYTIRYVTTRQLRFFEGYDELYWNVTGNFWSFPILKAEARVYLPDGARAIRDQVIAYTGPFGATGGNYTGSIIGGGSEVRFALTRPLGPEEGMTIAVGFTEGVVTRDDGTSFAGFTDNIGIFLLILGWLGVPAYFLYAWNRVGRDPPSPPVIPLFHPPEKLSPAALSYAHFNGFRSGKKGIDLPFIAALLSLGVKRFLQIDEDSRGTVTLQRGEAAGPARFAGAAERREALYSTLACQPRGDHSRQAQWPGPEECRDEAADGHIPRICGPVLQRQYRLVHPRCPSRYRRVHHWPDPSGSAGRGYSLPDPGADDVAVRRRHVGRRPKPFRGRAVPATGSWAASCLSWGAAVFLIGSLVVLAPSDLPIYRLAGALVIIGWSS
jgi:hypothetical protein